MVAITEGIAGLVGEVPAAKVSMVTATSLVLQTICI
jgi:hypothetical protein